MRRLLTLLLTTPVSTAALLIAPLLAAAQAGGPTKPLTLEDYLAQVKAQNPQARAVQESLSTAELRLQEADVPWSSEAYGEYRLLDDQTEPPNNFQPNHTRGAGWKLGVRDQTLYGLSTDFYVNSQHNELMGMSPFINSMTNYYQTRVGVNLQQSLWRNSFGKANQAEYEAAQAQSRMELLKQKYALKNLLLQAENTYWALVTANQIIKLQEENLERALRLKNVMAQKANLRLVDDVESLQAQAAYETRQLELQTSMDERSVLTRAFNTLRGSQSNQPEALAELPTNELLTKNPSVSRRPTREDFQMASEAAEVGLARSRAAKSRIGAQLDLQAGISASGLDGSASKSFSETSDMSHPTWSVGVVFSVPLDYSLIKNMRQSYERAGRAAQAEKEQAHFNEERVWNDLVAKNREAQGRFERAQSLEKLQTELVRRERQRLNNGRTTTFQAITLEQNLALAQIQRVRTQLALLEVHNLLKTFEDKP